MDGRGRDAAHAEHGAEEVRARAQVLLRAQELDGGTLLLQRVVRCGGAHDLDRLGGEFEGLGCLGGELERTRGGDGCRDVLMRDVVVVGERLAVHDDLQVAEAAAVVHGDEAEVLHVADGFDPTRDGDGLATKLLSVRIELDDFSAVHSNPRFLGVFRIRPHDTRHRVPCATPRSASVADAPRRGRCANGMLLVSSSRYTSPTCRAEIVNPAPREGAPSAVRKGASWRVESRQRAFRRKVFP